MQAGLFLLAPAQEVQDLDLARKPLPAFLQGERPLVVLQGYLVGEARRCQFPGPVQVAHRPLALPRQLQVVGDQAGVLVCSLATLLHQPLGDQPVVDATQSPQDALVGHLAQHGVLEDVLTRSGKGRRLAPEDHLPGPQGGQDMFDV